MMLIYWLCLLVSTCVIVDAGSTLCSKCASNYIVYNWEKIHLKRNMRSMDEIAGDDGCLNVTNKTPTVRCNDQCALFTVVASNDGQEHIFGVYRDCSTAVSFYKLMQKIDPNSKKLEIELDTVRNYERKIVFELCDGYLCNGNYKEQNDYHAQQNDPFHWRKRNSGHLSLFNPLVLISTLFLYFI